MDKIDIFYFLKAMTIDKKELDFTNYDIYKNYSIYMINRFVSMVECFIPFINEVNKYTMTKQSHYNLLKSILPKQKIYFKYMGKKKDLSLRDKKYIATYFEIGLKEAENYINLLSEDIIKEILKMYKYGRNKTVDV